MSKPEERKARVGDRVYYVARGSLDGKYPPVDRSATVTQESPTRTGDWTFTGPMGRMVFVGNQYLSLMVENPEGLFFNHEVKHDESGTPGTWHFIPNDPLVGRVDYLEKQLQKLRDEFEQVHFKMMNHQLMSR